MEANYNIVVFLPYIYMNLPWCTYVPHPELLSPSHPSGSSQCTSPKHPVSCIKPELAIHFTYDNIHVSMSFSQIIQPSPSPIESKRLFYTSVSLLLSCMQGYHYHLSKVHIYVFNSVQSLSHVWLSMTFIPSTPGHPCPSPTPGVYSNSCPLSRWCHPAISSSVVPFSSCPQSLPASGSFLISKLFTWGGQSIGVSASTSVLPMNT